MPPMVTSERNKDPVGEQRRRVADGASTSSVRWWYPGGMTQIR